MKALIIPDLRLRINRDSFAKVAQGSILPAHTSLYNF